MNRPEKTILSITGGSHLSVHALMLAFPSLIPIIRGEFSVGLDTLGFVATFSAFMFGLGAIPAGWVENKFGGRNLMIVYQFGSGIAALTIAFSSSFSGMVWGLGFMGLFCSIYHPAGLTIISHRIKALTRGMAIHGVYGSTGSALGPILATALASLLSWRAAYAFLGIFNLILAIITFMVIPYHNRKTAQENILHNNHGSTNKPALVFFYITNILMGMAYYGFTTFMPIHFAENTSMILPSISDNMKAGLFPTLVFLAGIFGQLIGGHLGGKFSKPWLLIILVSANIPILIILGFTTNLPLVLFSIILGITYFSSQPIINTLIAEFTDSSDRGLGFGINFFLSFGIGALAAGACGIIAEYYSVSFVFPVMGLLLIPAVFSAIMVKRYAGVASE